MLHFSASRNVGGCACGVIANGRRINAGAVLSNANLKTTIAKLVGYENVPPPFLGGFALDSHRSYYYVVMPLALTGIYFSFSILRSDIGRAFKALREDPLAAAASGVNVRKYKVIAFVLSALYAGATQVVMDVRRRDESAYKIPAMYFKNSISQRKLNAAIATSSEVS